VYRTFSYIAVMYHTGYHTWYGVALVSRIDKMIGLFCKRALSKRRYSAKETCHVIDPTDRSHPISYIVPCIRPYIAFVYHALYDAWYHTLYHTFAYIALIYHIYIYIYRYICMYHAVYPTLYHTFSYIAFMSHMLYHTLYPTLLHSTNTLYVWCVVPYIVPYNIIIQYIHVSFIVSYITLCVHNTQCICCASQHIHSCRIQCIIHTYVMYNTYICIHTLHHKLYHTFAYIAFLHHTLYHTLYHKL